MAHHTGEKVSVDGFHGNRSELASRELAFEQLLNGNGLGQTHHRVHFIAAYGDLFFECLAKASVDRVIVSHSCAGYVEDHQLNFHRIGIR
jgi:hypothetical protein